MSSGKGASDTQARASGLCEGLRRYSGVFRGDEVRRRASARQLGGAAVPLNDCLQFSDRQYRERDILERAKIALQFRAGTARLLRRGRLDRGMVADLARAVLPANSFLLLQRPSAGWRAHLHW